MHKWHPLQRSLAIRIFDIFQNALSNQMLWGLCSSPQQSILQWHPPDVKLGFQTESFAGKPFDFIA
jgi:hypothetical protein